MPTIATAFLTSQNHAHGNPYILAFDSSIHESGIQGHVTGAHAKTRMITFQQGDSKTRISFSFQQTIWIREIQSKSNHPSNWCKSDVSFLERSNNAKFTVALFDNAITSNQRSCITSRVRPRQTKARNECSISQSRQVVFFLFIGSVTSEKLPRPKAVWHSYSGVGIKAMCR